MIILIVFALLAGVVTILSPCILPILPIVLSGTVGGGKRKPIAIIVGFISSFTFFTLFLSAIVKALGVSADSLRAFSIIVVFLFGLSLLAPRIKVVLEKLFSKLAGHFSIRKTQGQSDIIEGFLIGMSLGLVWTPCVGPILASVISLALSGDVNGSAVLITLAYAVGTALPMLGVMIGGRELLQKNQWLLANTGKIQKAFGVLMIVTATALATNTDRKFQTYILETFPNYGTGLTAFEDIPLVRSALDTFGSKPNEKVQIGKPMNINIPNDLGAAPELIPGGLWFNSPPLTISELRGKVVLIDFWTYTCINCIRTLPYLKAWNEKYKENGLVIIGVHTPEFEFEKNAKNVELAIRDFSITYPVVQDNDYATWRAYNNRFWPAKYLIDHNGRIRYTHFGEGAYDETEIMIQKLLSESGKLVDMPIQNQEYQVNSKTPELYIGYQRMSNLFTNELPKPNQKSNYSLRDSTVPVHQFGLIGDWIIKDERAEPSAGSSLQLQFEAQEVFLVMRPTAGQKLSRVLIRLDGQTVDKQLNNAGEDVVNQRVEVTKDRLYKLIKLSKPGNHHLYLEFIDGNVELYAFTFG